jgi:general secretion pathway protein G
MKTSLHARLRKSRQRKLGRRLAFTLMEVLLVLAILVILGGMVGLMYQNVQGGANVKAAKTQINLLQQAVKMYQLNVQDLPADLNALISNPGMDDAEWGGPYIEKLPQDPWGQPYNYTIQDGKAVISSNGPDKQANTADDITG